jgi:competence protein ComEA
MGWIFVLVFGSLAFAQEEKPVATNLPPGAGRETVIKVCTKCHDMEAASRMRFTKDRWAEVVDDMVSRGAEGTDDELDAITTYLASNFGKDKPAPKTNVNKATATFLAAALGLPKETAAAIVADREKNGAFKDWQDLKRVPGIDMKLIESKKDQIEF